MRAPNDHAAWEELFEFLEDKGYTLDDFWDEQYTRVFHRLGENGGPCLYVTIECSGLKPEPHTLICEAFETWRDARMESWEGKVSVDFSKSAELTAFVFKSLAAFEGRAIAAVHAARPEGYAP